MVEGGVALFCIELMRMNMPLRSLGRRTLKSTCNCLPFLGLGEEGGGYNPTANDASDSWISSATTARI